MSGSKTITAVNEIAQVAISVTLRETSDVKLCCVALKATDEGVAIDYLGISTPDRLLTPIGDRADKVDRGEIVVNTSSMSKDKYIALWEEAFDKAFPVERSLNTLPDMIGWVVLPNIFASRGVLGKWNSIEKHFVHFYGKTYYTRLKTAEAFYAWVEAAKVFPDEHYIARGDREGENTL